MSQSPASWQSTLARFLTAGQADKAAQLLDEQLRSNRELSNLWPPFLKGLRQNKLITDDTWVRFVQTIAQEVRHPNPLHFLAQSFLAADDAKSAVTLYGQARTLGAPVDQIDQLLAQAGQNITDNGPIARWFDSRLTEKEVSDRATVLALAGRFFLTTGRIIRAIEALTDLERVAGTTAENSVNLATAHETISQFEDALFHLDQAIRQGAKGAEILERKARLLAQLRQMDDAIEAMDECLSLYPDFLRGRLQKAIWLERLNRLEDANHTASEALERSPDNIDMQVLRLRIARRQKKDPIALLEETKALISSTAFEKASPQVQVHGFFELAEQADRTGAYADAWTAYTRGNAAACASPVGLRVNEQPYLDQIVERRNWLKSVHSDQLPRPTAHVPVVFFVGFPRSGTTLMEQMLDSHPAITTLDEKPLLSRLFARLNRNIDSLTDLSDDARMELQTAYFEQAGYGYGLSPGHYLLDKLPLNLINLDLVRFIFPGAKVLMAVRDPRDCCLSNLAQNFVLNEAMKHFTDPAKTASLYCAVMDYYRTAQSALDLSIHEYRYEDLVNDPETVLRKIVDFLVLDWSDDLLDHTKTATSKFISTPSYEKVQAPVGTSAVSRWKNYWPWLAEPFSALDLWIEYFGYENS